MLVFFLACSNDELAIENGNNTKVEKDIEVVKISNGLRSLESGDGSELVLKFRNETVYNQTMVKLDAMSEYERIEWLQSFDGFKSLRLIYEEAMEEATFLDESETAYMAFKGKYDKYLYFPMYEEDYGAYMPVSNRSEATLVNGYGIVIVGDKTKILKDIETYEDLQKTGQAYYDEKNESMLMTRAVTAETIYNIRNRYIGEEQNSGWDTRSSRKLQVKFGLQGDGKVAPNPFTLKLHLEVSFRKKTWVGWVNYSTTTTTTGSIKIGDINTTINFSKNGSSSHDWYSPAVNNWWRYGTTASGLPLYHTPHITANISTTLPAFSGAKSCNFTLPSVAFTNN